MSKGHTFFHTLHMPCSPRSAVAGPPTAAGSCLTFYHRELERRLPLLHARTASLHGGIKRHRPFSTRALSFSIGYQTQLVPPATRAAASASSHAGGFRPPPPVGAVRRAARRMVVVDASEFGTEGFDPKRWINAALDARHPSEPLDCFLADAEEPLRATADDAGAALKRDSADALRRVPLACRDALRLRDDAVAIRSHLASVLQSLSQAERYEEMVEFMEKVAKTVNCEKFADRSTCPSLPPIWPPEYHRMLLSRLLDTTT